MRRKRKKKSIAPVIIILLVLILICAVLWRFVFVVRNVDVTGNSGAVSQEGVIRAARVQFGASIFGVDAASMAERIDATGHLRTEDISIRYPNTISITVAPRNRLAMALHLGQIRVLDEQGVLIESLSDVPGEELIYISGLRVNGCTTGAQISADAEQLSAYCNIMQAILANGADAYVSEINLDNPDDIRIITRTGVTVEMGDSSNAQDKIAWMKGAVTDLENRGQGGGVLDVRSGTKADYRPG